VNARRVHELAAVLEVAGESCRILGDGSVEVRDACHDDRDVRADSLFCCVRGERVDGHDLAASAVARGAVALLVDHPIEGIDVPQLVCDDVRRAMGPVAAAVHGDPSRALTVVGITGTNGKTTTAHLVAAILEAAGRRCEVLGTLSGARTTPEATDLQRNLAGWRDGGRDAVAMEVSSHALAQHRVDGTRFTVAAFTNLGRDHLDYHNDMESYFLAKARLFTAGLADGAVVCIDDPAGRRLAGEAEVPVTTCSVNDVGDLDLGATGSTFTWRGHEVRLQLPGRFNVANAVVAATVTSLLGVPDDVVAEGLGTLGAVPGRFERIDHGQPFGVLVDFAHTPDALEHLLGAVRDLTAGRSIVVFGCGGDRDTSKRPAMGAVAAAGADAVVVTADNSRTEDTGAIVESILEGVRTVPGGRDRCTVELDRRAAIDLALGLAGDGDIVVIAGRGHERELTIGPVTVPFDDRVVAADLLAARGWAA
jgi:UDP-N-acetylmuramoyl-L-alanyl-D-glutamate--2,6-diaminopimelate ligase